MLGLPDGSVTKESPERKLAENVTQAVARDVLAEAMLGLDAAGFRIMATSTTRSLPSCRPVPTAKRNSSRS
jgi:hypothetical protein